MVGVHHAPQPDNDPDANEMEALIKFEGPDTVAAIIAEPISTAAGLIMPPPQYLKRLREIADKHGIVLILDEVINGWGRTGTYFACEQFGVVPDIMTMAKGLSSGYAPIAAAVVRPHIAEAFAADEKHTLRTASPLAAIPPPLPPPSPTSPSLNKRKSSVMPPRWARTSRRGCKASRRHPMVRSTRGLGMMHVLGLTKDKATGTEWKATMRRRSVCARTSKQTAW